MDVKNFMMYLRHTDCFPCFLMTNMSSLTGLYLMVTEPQILSHQGQYSSRTNNDEIVSGCLRHPISKFQLDCHSKICIIYIAYLRYTKYFPCFLLTNMQSLTGLYLMVTEPQILSRQGQYRGRTNNDEIVSGCLRHPISNFLA